MHQKEGLSRERSGTPIANLTEAQFGNFNVGTSRIRAATPVGHAVHAANRVGSEAIDGTRRRGTRRHATGIRIIVDGVGGQPEDGRRLIVGSDGGEGEDEKGEEAEDEKARTCGSGIESAHG